MTYDIVRYEEEHRNAVIRLRQRSFGGSRRTNAAHFRWKYEDNPYVPTPLIYLALAGSTVVGMRGMYGGRWQLPGESDATLVTTAADTAVAPEHRGRYLFEQIMSAAEVDLRDQGHRFVLNFSANRATALLSRRAGWKRAGPFEPYRTAPIAVAADQSSLAQPGLRAALAKVRPRLRGYLQRRRFDRWERGSGSDLKVMSDLTVTRMAAVVRRSSDDGTEGVRRIRDESYFRWRFAAPRSDYRFLFVGPADAPDAFAVLLVPRTDAPVRIVDWDAASAEAWSTLLDRLPPPEVATIESWSAGLGPGRVRALAERGWTPVAVEDTRRRPASGVLYRSLRGDEALPDLRTWVVRMSDSDAF